MKAKSNESFSAFLDGEASELDIQRMLRALDEQPELFEKWHSLSKVQAELQNETIVDVALAFDAQSARSDQESPQLNYSKRIWQSGIAAAVALVVITSVNLMDVNPPAVVISTTDDSNSQANSALIAQSQFEAQQRLDLYLREHAEQASFTTGHVVAPSELEWLEADSE